MVKNDKNSSSSTNNIKQEYIKGQAVAQTGKGNIKIHNYYGPPKKLKSIPLKQKSSYKYENIKNKTSCIFLGHGRSAQWLHLKDFIVNRLNLECNEFNSDAVAGMSTKERLLQLLNKCNFAFIVMTAEDMHADGKFHARENVVHEAGLFQGKYGFERSIILLEENCTEFSNIQGITQIRFPKGNIMACSEEIRRVLEREGILH